MPVDVKKQIAYWRKGARDDMEAAQVLLEGGKKIQALFFAHLALEKALKAHVVRATRDLAPHTHNLITLAQRSGLQFPGQKLEFLAEMNRFSVRGRYPTPEIPSPSLRASRKYLSLAKEMLDWLTGQF